MLRWVKKHLRILKTCNLYLCMFTVGLGVSLTGPCLLDLQRMVGTDTQHIALIYTTRSIGFLLGAIFGGILLDLVKSKQAVLTGCNAIVTATMLGIPWIRKIETLMGFMVANGISLGAIETGANVVILQLWGKDSAPFFQALSFTYGLGGLISPLIAAPFLDDVQKTPSSFDDNATYLENSLSNFTNSTTSGDVKITYPFSIVGAFGFLITLLLLLVCIISPTDEEGPEGDKLDNSDRSFPFICLVSIVIFLLFFVAAGTEIGYAQTLTTYAVKGRLHTTEAVGSYMTSAFWAAFTLFRLLSVYLSIKFRPMELIISDICIMAVSALILLFLMPQEWALWLATVLFGIGIASCYPSLVEWINTQINITSKISSVFAVGGAAGEMVVPFVIAYFMESVPEMFAFVVAASSVLLACLLFVQYCIFKNGNRRNEEKRMECYVINNPKEQELCNVSARVVVS